MFERETTRLAGLAAALALSAVMPAQTDRDLFDDQVLHEIRVFVHRDDWKDLREHYLEDTYYPADLSWRGVEVRDIGIRSRGGGSRSPLKPNLHVAFDRYVPDQRFAGLRRLVLKANNQDASMMAETVSLWLLRLMGIPAPRASHARLLVNDEYFGLYTIVEDVTEDFLARVFRDPDGYLYEYKNTGGFRFDHRGDDPAQYWFFEPKTHEASPGIEAVVDLVRRVNSSPQEEFVAAVSPYLNLEGFVRLLAIENFLADNDGVLSSIFGMNNFYLYRPSSGMTAEFIPWDLDLTFNYPYRAVLEGIEGNVLARRALAVPQLRRLYLETLIEAATLAGGAGGRMHQEIQRQFTLIAGDARAEPNKQCMKTGVPGPCTSEDFELAIYILFATLPLRTPFVLEEAARLLSPGELRLDRVVNMATVAPALAPGGLATLYGGGLATAAAHAERLPLPYTLGGVTVTVHGSPAPVLFVSPSRIHFQIPWNAPPGEASIVVSGSGGASPIRATIAPVAPGVFGAVHAHSFGVIRPGDPAHAGDTIVVYATGLGPVTPPVGDGEAPPSDRLAVTVETPAVTVDGRPASVLFAGLTPGFVGVYQVNIEVPEGISAGYGTPLVVTAGSQAAPAIALSTR